MTQALLIVDVQNDYFAGGSMELVGMDSAAANCRMLLDAFRDAGAPLYHVRHLASREGATFFVPGTPGAEIHPGVEPAPGENVITKHFPSAFRDTGLHETLQEAGIDQLLICGAMSHMCVDTTVRAAFDLGYRCRVAADACATRELQFGERRVAAEDVHAAYMAALAAVFAEVQPSAALLEKI